MEELDVDDIAFWIAVSKKSDGKILSKVRISKDIALAALREREARLEMDSEDERRVSVPS